MPRYLYGGSYDSIAQQEMGRDQARDQRFFQSIAASQRLREQMDQEALRAAQFQAQQQQFQQQQRGVSEGRNIEAALQMAQLAGVQSRADAVRQQEALRLRQQENAALSREALGMQKQDLLERKFEFEKNKPAREYGTPNFADRIRLDELAKRDKELGEGSTRLADLLNRKLLMQKAIAGLPYNDPNRRQVEAQITASDDLIAGYDKGIRELVQPDQNGTYKSVWKARDLEPLLQRLEPSAPGSAAAPKLPAGVTIDDIRRDAQRKIAEGYPAEALREAAMKKYGVQL